MELFKDLDPLDSEALNAQARRIYDKYIQSVDATLTVYERCACRHPLSLCSLLSLPCFFVRPGGELEVHLSPSSVHLVTREVLSVSPTSDGIGATLCCFDESQSELFQLMEAEFPRFLSSTSCEACLHELEKEEVLREVLEKSDMI